MFRKRTKSMAQLHYGLFDPAGVFWRVNRESALLIGGGTALLMQIAHPKIAAGVAAHSDYRQRPIRRLYQTITAMQRIIYGDRDTALKTAANIRDIHRRVNGVMGEGSSLYPEGSRYSAEDPALVMWVYASLIETMLRVYPAVFSPLSVVEMNAFYEESKIIARLFGATDELIPPTLAEFREYVDGMLAGPELEITTTARVVAEDIIHPPITGIPNFVGDLLNISTLAFLPEVLRHRYGLKWDRKRQILWRTFRGSLRGTLPFAPDLVRVSRLARKAEKSVALG